ncbi:MAG TPA: ComEC/Rec2 family competence protein [Kocuria rosea]|nr:ComEC/Rec2 family competence protein [Kocuria rosea]
MNGPAGWWARALEHQEHRDARAPGRTWDLRLLPAALAAWATALLGTRLPPGQAALGGGAVLGLLALLGAVLPPLVHRAVRALHRGPGRASAVRRSRGAVPWSALGLAALAVAAVLLGTAAERRPLADGALGEALAGGGRFTVTAQVLEPPRPWASAGPDAAAAGEDRTGAVVRVRLDEVVRGGRGEAAGVPATVVADGPGWSALTPGARISAVLEAPPAPRPGALVLRAAAAPSTLPAERPPAREALRGRFVLATAGQGPDAAALLPGMTFGERAGLGPELEQAMQDTGLTHLTAVSGSNCALVTALAGHAALALGAGRRTCLLTGLGALAAFVALVGPDPSVLRASVMGALGALSLLTGRAAVSLATLAGAVVALVVARPALAAELGFVLSVLAAAGIVVSGRPLARLFGARVPEVLGVAVAIPAAAQLWCAPVLVLLQPAVPVYSLPANVLAGPLVPVVTVCGLAGLLLLGVPGDAAADAALLPLGAGAVGARLVAGIARVLAAAPGALLPWPEGPAGVALMGVLAATAVLGVHALDVRRRRPRPSAGTLRDGPAPPARSEVHRRLLARRRRRRRALVAGALLVVVVVLGLRALAELRRPPPAWEALVCDVGQGDAVLLRTGPDRAVLVDTGPDPRALDRCLRRGGVRELELVVLTHAHADHTGGLPALTRRAGVAEVWYSTAAPDPPAEIAAALPAVPVHRPAPGETRSFGVLRLTVLAPAGAAARRWGPPSSSEENDASLALRAELTGPDGSTVSWLLTGDLEEAGARALVRAAGPLADVDVLKVSHHGARNGGTGVVDAASPRLAVVSVGRDNDYGHPHPTILAHLEARGVPLLRTDRHGSVYLLRDGDRLRALPAGP